MPTSTPPRDTVTALGPACDHPAVTRRFTTPGRPQRREIDVASAVTLTLTPPADELLEAIVQRARTRRQCHALIGEDEATAALALLRDATCITHNRSDGRWYATAAGRRAKR